MAKRNPFIGAIANDVPTAFGRARPVRGYYFAHPSHQSAKDVSKIGRAKTPLGAIRAGVVKLLTEDLKMVKIYDERSACVFTIFKDRTELRVVGYIDGLREL